MCSERVKISFGPNGETKDFENLDELRSYFQSPDFISWANEISPTIQSDRVHLDRLIGNFINELFQITSHGDITHASTQIASLMNDRPFPTGRSPLAKWLKKLNQRDPDRAAYALFAAVNSPPSSFDFRCAKGAADLALYKAGISTETAEAGLQALNDARQEQEAELLAIRAARSYQKEDFEKLLVEINSIEKAAREERVKLNDMLIQRVEDQVNQKKAMLDSLEETYKTKMALMAPVEYWRQKADRHKIALEGDQKKWGLEKIVPLYFVSVFVIAASYISVTLYGVHVKGDTERAVAIATLGVLLTTTMLWYARILTRQLLRHRHLYEDAEERGVMIMSYLAMAAEGNVEKEDRVLALGAAFRAASDGVSSDDGAPDISTAAIIGRLVQNGR